MTEEVTQEARNAAADLLHEVGCLLGDDGIGQVADLIRDGEYDDHGATIAFAKFERETIARMNAKPSDDKAIMRELRPSKAAMEKIERMEQANAAGLAEIRNMPFGGAAQSGEGRSGAEPHNVDANGKPTDDSDPWFQLGWYKDRLERAETERDIWKERAMSLRIASRKAGLLQTALEDICDPIAALCRYADERGRQLDGAVAFQLANDPNHIKGIARAALRATDDAGWVAKAPDTGEGE